jgi:hypothetical protein
MEKIVIRVCYSQGCDDMNARTEAVRREDGGEAGLHGGGGGEVGLGAGALVVTPDGTRLSSIFDLEKPPRRGRGRSTPAYRKADRKIFREFLLGAHPR